jgi:hypothetical protein
LPPATNQPNLQHNPAVPSYLASNHWNVHYPRDAMIQSSDKSHDIRREGKAYPAASTFLYKHHFPVKNNIYSEEPSSARIISLSKITLRSTASLILKNSRHFRISADHSVYVSGQVLEACPGHPLRPMGYSLPEAVGQVEPHRPVVLKQTAALQQVIFSNFDFLTMITLAARKTAANTRPTAHATRTIIPQQAQLLPQTTA